MRIVQYKRNQALLMETPPSLPEEFTADVDAAQSRDRQGAGPAAAAILNEYEAMQLLAAYGIPVAETLTAHSPNEAADVAARLNQPVALKIISPMSGQQIANRRGRPLPEHPGGGAAGGRPPCCAIAQRGPGGQASTASCCNRLSPAMAPTN
jgi:hypothetical protein